MKEFFFLKIKKYKMLKDGLENLSGGALRIVVALISLPVIIKNLGIEQFGTLSILTAIVNLGALSEFGLSTYATIYTSGLKQKDKTNNILYLLGFAFLFSSITSIVLISATPCVSKILFPSYSSKQVSNALVWVGFAIIARACSQTMVGILNSHKCFRQTNKILSNSFILSQLALLFVSYISTDINNLSLVIFLGALMPVFFSVRKIKNYLVIPSTFNISIDLKKSRDILGKSVYMAANNMVNVSYNQVDKIILGIYLTQAQLGIYSTFTAIGSQLNALSLTVCAPLLSYLPGKYLKDSVVNYKNSTEICCIVAAGLSAALILMGPKICEIFFPAIPRSAFPSYVVIIWVYFLISLHAPAYYCLLALGKTKTILNICSFATIVSLLAILLGARFGGLIFACIGNLGYLIIAIMLYKVGKILGYGCLNLNAICAALLLTASSTLLLGYHNKVFACFGLAMFFLSATLFFSKSAKPWRCFKNEDY
jgi:O-antigen/teichoic acid export membrane protein